MTIAGIGGYAVFQTGLHELNSAVNTAQLLDADPQTKPQLTGNEIRGPINILMTGVDASGTNTDSIILAHIPAAHNAIYLISIPRDTRITTPSGGTNKINAMFNGQLGGLQKTLKSNFGINVNAGLIINFSGFENIVTKLGGIDMYVDETTYSIHQGYLNNNPNDHYKGYPYKINPNTGVPECSKHGVTWGPSTANECTLPGVKEVVYPKGMFHFNAYQALDFVRCRDGLVGTDYARQRHQQQFIRAVIDKVYSRGLSDPLQMLGLIQSMKSAFTFDGNGVPLQDWLFTLDKIGPSDMVTIKTNNGQFDSLPDNGDGHGSEQGLTDDSKALLAAARDDNATSDLVGAFLATHLDWAVGG